MASLVFLIPSSLFDRISTALETRNLYIPTVYQL